MALNFRIVTVPDSNMVRVDFERKVKWIGMTLEEATELHRLLGQHVDSLRTKAFGQGALLAQRKAGRA